MLVNVHVKNMALIREADILLGPGLNILSGETGAGKSILMGAVAVALGLQNFKGFAREGADYAFAELVFEVEDKRKIESLRSLGVAMEDGTLIISRRMSGGRSFSKINGETVPVSFVKKAADLLIDIHGQHENQTLHHIKKHLEILDTFAGNSITSVLETYHTEYVNYGRLLKKLEESAMDEVQRKKEMDFLKYELSEIEEANLQIGEDEELEELYRKLSNAREILEAVGQSHEHTGNTASDAIGRALRCLAGVTEHDTDLSELYGQLVEIDSLLNDFNREIADYADGLSVDDEKLRSIEERLNLINHLKSKYGGTIDKIQEYEKKQRERLAVLSDYETYQASLRKEYDACRLSMDELSAKLTDIRMAAAKQLADEVKCALSDLNFLDVRFELSFRRLGEFTAAGKDEVCFMISTNPGQPMRPVQDTASGGELSRIMLAIKAVMADREQVQTLIFDEIDSGISGRTAQKVSEKLAVIAKSCQVICITHLAQIAAMADVHFVIEKTVSDNDTKTVIRRLDQEESVVEIARILGGAQITKTVLESAREMKELAACTKKY